MPKGFEAEVVRDFDPSIDPPGGAEEGPDGLFGKPSKKPH
jgi:hypothetical protein